MSESGNQNAADLQVLLKRDWRMLIGGELAAAASGQTMTPRCRWPAPMTSRPRWPRPGRPSRPGAIPR